MKKLSPFAGVIALAVAFGLAGAASAGRPEGAGGGPPGGGSTSKVSQFSSRLVDVSCAANTESEPKRNCEVPDNTGEINSQGFWKVTTRVPAGSGPAYAICLDAVEAPEDTPFRLETLSAGDLFEGFDGIYAGAAGNWRGLSLQIRNGSDCNVSTVVLQESGLSLRSELKVGEEASTFTSPFVVPNCDPDPCEVTDSYGLIINDSDWVVLTDGLNRGTKYQVCVDAFIAPELVSPLPFRLASRSAQKKGTFFASGNMLDKYDFIAGHWVGLSLQIYLQNNTDFCDGGFVQETGIHIAVP